VKTLNADSKALLLSMAKSYRHQLFSEGGKTALEYLMRERALKPETLKRFGLGFVSKPAAPQDHGMVGRISIPYQTYSPVHGWSVVGIQYRSIGDAAGTRYLFHKGDTPTLYNPAALLRDTEYVCVVEGALDTVSAEQAGLPTIGIPGVHRWEAWMPRLLRGYKRVYVLQDDNKAGEQFAEKVSSSTQNTQVIVMPHGDTNKTLQVEGETFIHQLVHS